MSDSSIEPRTFQLRAGIPPTELCCRTYGRTITHIAYARSLSHFDIAQLVKNWLTIATQCLNLAIFLFIFQRFAYCDKLSLAEVQYHEG